MAVTIFAAIDVTMHEVKSIMPVAIASRSKECAEKFAKKYKLEKSYGSYIEMRQRHVRNIVYMG